MHLVNGQPDQLLTINDRGLMYGHGVFETVQVHNRKPLLWSEHLARLILGCSKLGLPLDADALEQEIDQVCDQNPDADFVLRVSQTMGEGGRGYLSPESPNGTRIVSTHALPTHARSNWKEGITLGVCSIRLSTQPALAGIKHANRLEQILARSEWKPGWHEGLVLDHDDNVIEATQSNVFVFHNGALKTPDLSACGVAGVMRECVLSLAESVLNLPVEVCQLSLEDISFADEIFVTNSLIGLWPVAKFENTDFVDRDLSSRILHLLVEHEAIPPY